MMPYPRTLEPEDALMTAAKLLARLCGLALAVSAATAPASPSHVSPGEMEEDGTGVCEGAVLDRWR